MFKSEDKLTLTLINMQNIDGKYFNISLSLPLKNKETLIPKDVAIIDVFEYHEGLTKEGSVVFSIYVGKISTISDIIPEIEAGNITVKDGLKIPSISSKICYQETSDKKNIFAVLQSQDIVVENYNQLIATIQEMSNEYTNICNSAQKIRTLHKKHK